MTESDQRAQIEQARGLLGETKVWVGGAVRWVPTGKKLPGMKFRNSIELPLGVQLAGLFVEGYFKQSRVPSAPDKLYFNLFFRNQRIHALHDNGPTRHLNEVGMKELYYMQRVDHPHRHRICDDAMEGYAEPFERMEASKMWTTFLAECRILHAPDLSLPAIQLSLPL